MVVSWNLIVLNPQVLAFIGISFELEIVLVSGLELCISYIAQFTEEIQLLILHHSSQFQTSPKQIFSTLRVHVALPTQSRLLWIHNS
jgi:hypothetical protein